jgi:pimeloyl-ACP methyl ester carboxylesterase
MQVQSNGIALEVEQHGPADGPPLLMIMGLGMQLTAWPDEWVQTLAAAGYRVIVFDNRDIGLSTYFDDSGRADLVRASWRHMFHLPVRAPYLLDDMAQDTVGLLDALGIERCHLLGLSMGGMIAQIIAARYPERVRTLTLMMTTSGARRLPGPSMKARAALLSKPANPRDPESVIENTAQLLGVIGSPGFPTAAADMHARLARNVCRAYHPQGMGRQLLAVMASADRTPLLAQIRAPTLVIHGRADPLVPVACGIDLAERIAGARLELIDGMGHDLPSALIPRLAASVSAHFQ